MKKVSGFLVFFILLNFLSFPIQAKGREDAQYITQQFTIILKALLEATQERGIEGKKITKFQQTFPKLLQKKFSEPELAFISDAYRKSGGSENFMRMTKSMISEMQLVATNSLSLKDIKLKISSSYDALLEKRFQEDNLELKLYAIYKKTPQDSQKKRNADKFVSIAKKHIKQAIANMLTEDQYRAWYDFEKSEVGKKYNTFVQESMVLL